VSCGIRLRVTAETVAIGVSVALLAAACGGSKQSSPPTTTATKAQTPPQVFADPAAPLRVVDRPIARDAGNVTIHDVSFAGRSGRVQGYLVVPAKASGRHPAVVLLHGAGGTRNDFLGYAVKLAHRGFVALTLTAPSSAKPIPSGLAPKVTLHREAALTIDDVVAVRRAVDMLRTRSTVDPQRVGLVGWSSGARTGAVLAGVEPRIRAFVLMSAGAVPVSAYVKAVPGWLKPDVRSTLTPLDPLRWIARARPGSVFLEDGRLDEVVPRPALMAIVHAAPQHTRVRWYQAPHRLNAEAVSDQLAWLEQRLAARS
jgi:dienelactone hydrolase